MFLLSCGAVISNPDSFKRLVFTTTLWVHYFLLSTNSNILLVYLWVISSHSPLRNSTPCSSPPSSLTTLSGSWSKGLPWRTHSKQFCLAPLMPTSLAILPSCASSRRRWRSPLFKQPSTFLYTRGCALGGTASLLLVPSASVRALGDGQSKKTVRLSSGARPWTQTASSALVRLITENQMALCHSAGTLVVGDGWCKTSRSFRSLSIHCI